MSKLKKPINFETIFDTYTVDELIGEGGAGRVYGGRDVGGGAIAVKLLTPDRATADRRRRFKNEVAFQSSIKHANIVSVIDNGVASGPDASGPFYIMRRYHGNLRDFIQQGIAPKAVLQLFSQILDGVEAAHLQGVIHRDLKPENILTDAESRNLAIADFGIARFTEDLVATAQTDPHQRLANFQYAAPEQRVPGRSVGVPADIYALALILNEMFTRTVAHGTDFKLIASVDDEFAFLDEIVKKMLKQVPEERPSSVAEVKALIQRHMAEAVSFQRLSEINGRVIKATEVDEPLAEIPPKLIAADWDGEILTLELDKPVTPEWIQALHSMGAYSSLLGKPPQAFSFRGNQAASPAKEHEVQPIIDNFKTWLPTASRTLKEALQQAAQREEAARKEQLRRERDAEEKRLRVLRNIKI